MKGICVGDDIAQASGVGRRPASLLVAGTVGLLATLTAPEPQSLAILSPVATAGAVALAVQPGSTPKWLVAGWGLGAAASVTLGWLVFDAAPMAVATALLVVGLGVALRPSDPGSRWVPVALGGLAVGIAVTVISALTPVGIDVHALHVEATETLTQGGNPWTDLAVGDTAPDAAGATIDGYPYPVLTLGLVAVATVLTGEPRIALIVVWLMGCLALIVGMSRSQRSPSSWKRNRDDRDMTVAAALLIALPPTVSVIEASWTEPISFGLLAAGLATWATWPVSGVLLGLALASKQYLALLVPLVLGMRTMRQRRATILAVAAAAVLPGFLLGRGYLAAIIGSHASRSVRDDATNLVGLLDLGHPLDAGIINAVAVAAALLVGGWLARRIHGPAGFAKSAAATLSVFFLLSAQAFGNYWWLACTLLLAALVMSKSSLRSSTDHAPLH